MTIIRAFFLLDNLFCFAFRLLSCLANYFGLSDLEPSPVIAKWFNPRSIPIALPSVELGGKSFPFSTNTEAKYYALAFLDTFTVLIAPFVGRLCILAYTNNSLRGVLYHLLQ